MDSSEKIRQSLVCQICDFIYKQPVKLPCGKTICKSHFPPKRFSWSLWILNDWHVFKHHFSRVWLSVAKNKRLFGRVSIERVNEDAFWQRVQTQVKSVKLYKWMTFEAIKSKFKSEQTVRSVFLFFFRNSKWIFGGIFSLFKYYSIFIQLSLYLYLKKCILMTVLFVTDFFAKTSFTWYMISFMVTKVDNWLYLCFWCGEIRSFNFNNRKSKISF